MLQCARCTSSITASNRATNGHRFVFHSTEVAGSERHYVKDEPSVMPLEPSQPSYYVSYHHQEQDQSILRTPPLEFVTPDLIASRNRNMESNTVVSSITSSRRNEFQLRLLIVPPSCAETTNPPVASTSIFR